MADILQEVRDLNENDAEDSTEIKGLVKMLDEKYNKEWKEARFLGRGTVTVSYTHLNHNCWLIILSLLGHNIVHILVQDKSAQCKKWHLPYLSCFMQSRIYLIF